MKDDARSQLAKIIGDYDERLAVAEKARAELQAAHAAFPGRFVTLRDQTLRPAMQEIADMLSKRGHEATLREQDESSTAEGGIKSAAMSLHVVPRPFAVQKAAAAETSPSAIEITFSANRRDRKVAVSSTNTLVSQGGTVGKRAEYEIDAVTADIVATHVIQTLTEAFGTAR